jgi:hypothetical protein
MRRVSRGSVGGSAACSNVHAGIGVTSGVGEIHVSASRSRCWRIALAEPGFMVTVSPEVRRNVRVARLTVKVQMARTITAIRLLRRTQSPAECGDCNVLS